MDIDIIHKNILADLFSSEKGLMPYTFYTRYGITPADMIDFINKYKELKTISIDQELRIRLTEEGRKSVYGIYKRIEAHIRKENNKSEYLGDVQDKKMDLYTPYVPDRIFYDKKYKGEQKETRD